MGSFEAVLAGLRLVPVLVIESPEHVAGVAEALSSGGLPCVEVTLRAPGALAALREFANDPRMLVGAGTVVLASQVDDVVGAGARFVVSPGYSQDVVDRCHALGVPVLPGVSTPTEVMRAMDCGLGLLKVFPAGTLGGPAGVRSLTAPFPSIRIVPTGGVGPGNLAEYLGVKAVVAVGGSWMVDPVLIRERRYDEIRRLTQAAVTVAKEARP